MLERMIPMMTTAELRNEAREFERARQWECAALCWHAAAEKYPGNPRSALAQADIAGLRARAESCFAQSESERTVAADTDSWLMRLGGGGTA